MKNRNIQIKPITNDEEFAEANEMIELLLECPEGSEEEKILEAITILACEYEKKQYPIPKPNPIEAIKYLRLLNIKWLNLNFPKKMWRTILGAKTESQKY